MDFLAETIRNGNFIKIMDHHDMHMHHHPGMHEDHGMTISAMGEVHFMAGEDSSNDFCHGMGMIM